MNWKVRQSHLLLPLRIVKLIAIRRHFPQLVIHRSIYTETLPHSVLLQVFCRGMKGAFRRPPNLAIVVIHNRTRKTLMEQSLEYLGIPDYTTLLLPPGKWRHTMKVPALQKFLVQTQAEYVLYADADDALMCGDPATAIGLLEDAECDMLVSSTVAPSNRGLERADEWARSIAPTQTRNVYLNSGVFIARTTFLRQFIDAVATYVCEEGATIPGRPRGAGSDQAIFRFLHPEFYPRVKIDYAERLALR